MGVAARKHLDQDDANFHQVEAFVWQNTQVIEALLQLLVVVVCVSQGD